MKFKYLIKSLIVNIYLNNYILSKAKLYFCFYIWGFAAKHTVVPYPTSFATEGSACGIATKKLYPRQARIRFAKGYILA